MEIDSRYAVLIIFAVFIAAFIFLIRKDMKETKKSRKLKERAIKDEDLSAGIEEYRREIKNLIKEIQEKQARGDSLAELAARCEEYRSKVITGIMDVDVLLSYKEKLCSERSITLNYEIGRIDRPVLEEKEYLSLFGNLIDNAIEAAVRCDTKEITVKAHLIKGQWVLTVINTKPSDEHPIETGMATTKADSANHGIGSKVIDRIAKKNKGVVKRIDKGDTFEVIITIPQN